MNSPVSGSGTFDPLAPPGSMLNTVSTTSATFSPGQFVIASMDNTAFFSRRPRGDAEADKLLRRNTQMKVISSDSSYLRVELDSGEVGFVPSVMVDDPSMAPPVTSDGMNPGEFQVYPPLPVVDDGLGTLPVFETPGATPDATISETLPVEPEEVMAPESVPLPPNHEDLEAEGLRNSESAD